MTTFTHSKPVKLQIQVGNEYEWEYMEVWVKHFGESDYGSLWITNNLNATCNPDWSSSDDDNKIYINNWTASFYTCGASYFVIKRIWTGVITIAQPLSWSSSCMISLL